MARRTGADSRVTRRQIMDAALDLFAERGFYGTGMREIGAAAGITGSALYHHFPSKEAILVALFEEMIQAGQLAVSRVLLPDPVPPLDALLRGFCLQVLKSFDLPAHKKFYRVLMADGFRLAQDGVVRAEQLGHEHRRHLAGLLRRLMELGHIRTMDPEHASILLMGPLLQLRQITMMWGVPKAGGPDKRAFVDTLVANLVRAWTP